MDDVARVQVAECGDDLRTDELDCWLAESSNAVDVVVDVPAWQVLQEEVDLELVLEDEVHGVDEGVVGLEEDLLFVLDVLYLLLLKEKVFVDALHRIHLAHLPVVDQEHFSEATFVDHFRDFEIFKIDLLALETWLADEALGASRIFDTLFPGEVLYRVVLFHVGRVQHHEVVEKLVL